MIRVVLDTNVFISSFFGGNPRKIIDLWKSGGITLCLSRAIVEEYMEVLQRLGLQDTRELKELLNLFAESFNSVFSSSPPTLDVVADDPDDNKFIECAVALKSAFIISGDQHLKSIGAYMDIRIVSPKEFLELHERRDLI